MSSFVRVASALAGLLPFDAETSAHWYQAPHGVTLIADPRYGVPTARDLLTLVLCADAALCGSMSLQVEEGAVDAESLARVAGLRMQVDDCEAPRTLPLAVDCSSSQIELNPRWCEWLMGASRIGKLPRSRISRLHSGPMRLAITLATESESISAAEALRRCGSRVTKPIHVRQQVKRWLKKLHEAGFTEWAFDPVTAVLFRVAQVPPQLD
ncbi:hypothetical protein [Haliangium ochraceum]|uniref:Uncharacterized protein n=1 Tax=Haliangium ochraceum (strain DSM 14365 / JCM 11303 / SMP-2) TaxID=502025 RepID=D0LNC9_HALO1|nr:hypothetical protein [Haliangium ochraceum]ACY15306.1 hypothetical protein Hoch_2779 [Haliangium ochraceum DSM 14365]